MAPQSGGHVASVSAWLYVLLCEQYHQPALHLLLLLQLLLVHSAYQVTAYNATAASAACVKSLEQR